MKNLPRAIATTGFALMLNLIAVAAHAEVVVVVSSQNPVETLSRTELTDIYLGRAQRWPNGEPVVPIDQNERVPAYEEFYRQYLERSPAQVKAHWSKLIFTGRGRPPRNVENGEAMAELIADNPNAIGYIDSELVNDRLQMVRIE